jgi:hypothetical protein
MEQEQKRLKNMGWSEKHKDKVFTDERQQIDSHKHEF